MTQNKNDDHHKLKNLGVQLLVSMGYNRADILKENKIMLSDQKGKFALTVIPDVCVKSGNLNNMPSIAIECGECELEKLYTLEKLFDKVLRLPYGLELLYTNGDANSDLIEKLNNRIEFLESTIETKTEESAILKNKMLRYRIDAIKLEIISCAVEFSRHVRFDQIRDAELALSEMSKLLEKMCNNDIES